MAMKVIQCHTLFQGRLKLTKLIFGVYCFSITNQSKMFTKMTPVGI